MNDEPEPARSSLAIVQGHSDPEDEWLDDGRAEFVREAERRTASIIDATDARHRLLLANIEASERRLREFAKAGDGNHDLQEALDGSLRRKTGKDDSVGAVQSSRGSRAQAFDEGAMLDALDQVGSPSPGLVEAFDDCLASLAPEESGWTGADAFGDPPRRREQRWRSLAGKLPFYCVTLALAGSAGWLVDVAVNALAK